MRYTVFDIETNGLKRLVTLIHCISYKIYVDGHLIEEGSITDYEEMKTFILNQNILVGHNIIRYDIPVLEEILGIKINATLIDTLGLSWYLYPMRLRHGLEIWGEELEVEKPHIEDWNNLAIEDYIHRCETDVEINQRLFVKQYKYLQEIYESDSSKIDKFISYLGFKLDCAREQEEVGCKIDMALVNKSMEELLIMQQEKIDNLVSSMPKNIKYKEVSKPSKTLKKDGSLSVQGIKWYTLLQENNFPNNYSDTIMVKVSEEPGNPSSSQQMKDWLFSLGWEPIAYEYRKNKAGDVNEVPQIYVGDEVCNSIKELYPLEPSLENLDMLSLINHRLGIFKSYEKSIEGEDTVYAQIAGFTNTLRFKHKKPINFTVGYKQL